jgi:hypothetical protein
LGGFIPTCRAQTCVETAKLETSMDVLSRRQFIAISIALALTIAPLRLEQRANNLPTLSMAADLHRRALAKRLKQLNDGLRERIGCQIAVNQILSGIRKNWGDSEHPDVVLAWLESMDRKQFEALLLEVHV